MAPNPQQSALVQALRQPSGQSWEGTSAPSPTPMMGAQSMPEQPVQQALQSSMPNQMTPPSDPNSGMQFTGPMSSANTPSPSVASPQPPMNPSEVLRGQIGQAMGPPTPAPNLAPSRSQLAVPVSAQSRRLPATQPTLTRSIPRG